jgi:hypothetical protein
MSSKYDLEKSLDPYGIEKFQKTITRITNPWKEHAAMNTAMASITSMYDNSAIEAMKKAAIPWKEHAAMNTAMASIASMYDNSAIEAMKKAAIPWKEHAAMNTAMASIANMYDNSAIEVMKKAAIPWKEHAAMNTAMASIASMYDNSAIEVMKKAASSLAINKSLGLQADIQRLIAAKTLMPDLNTKIFNLNQKLSAISGLTEQRLNQNYSNSIQNYLDTLEEFNEKYDQDIHIDKTAIQTLDLILHQQETLELTSELRNIGIFDTSSGSIFLEYSETLSTSKASAFLNLIICILVWFAEPIINQYEPIQNLQEKSANFLNGVDGIARITKDCDLKDQPNGLKKIRLEKESVVTLYKKNDEGVDGWSKIKFNKDGHDITGYIRTSELHSLD